MFVLPVAFAIGCIVLFLKKRYKGLLLGSLFFCLAIAIGFWSITQSRSSTAAIGFLLLPGFGAVCGSLGWMFSNFRHDPEGRMRVVSWLCLCGSLGLLLFSVSSGFKEKEKNREGDQVYAQYSRQVDESRNKIRELLEKNQGNEVAALDDQIQAHLDDSAFLVAALETQFVSEKQMDRLSRFTRPKSGGVVLSVIR